MNSALRNPFASLLLASALALPAAPALAQERVVIGNAASVVGKVTLDNSQLRRPIDVERRQRIAWADLIETKRNAQLQILLLDRSSLSISERSRVRIDRYTYDPAQGRSMFSTLIKGALRFFSGSSGSNNSAEVSTPAGRIGIRGTAVDMLVGKKAEDIAEDEESVGKMRSDNDEATLVVLRGPSVNSGLQRGIVDVTGAGVTVTLDEPGLAAYIPEKGAAPIGPFRISNGGLARVQDQLAPRWADSFKDGGIPGEAIAGAALAAILGVVIATSGDDDDNDATGTTTDGAPLQGGDGANSGNPDFQGQNDNCEDANGEPVPCPPIG